jgi:N-acetyl-anhydromuramyl-L-alanine amidase AmpD
MLAVAWCAVLAACSSPGAELRRRGDEIMVAGRLFHTGAPVVLWTDPGGYDAYRVERRFVPIAEASWEATQKAGKTPETPNRYGTRSAGLSADDLERVRGGGWDLPTLQRTVDQFVLHYDVCGTSRTCFRVLQDMRGLSVHFLLDVDGTIYQTLDVKERAWHATVCNDRSVGVEIANIGAYPPDKPSPLDEWYATEAGRTRLTIPPRLGDGGLRRPGAYAPARAGRVIGEVHGQRLAQYDLTPQQYDSLAKLTAALCRVLPRIAPDAPRDKDGRVLTRRLTDDELAAFRGVLGHFHIQDNKIDPGPALDWDRVLREARR